MINLLNTSTGNKTKAKVTVDYNKLFMLAWFNRELMSQEDKYTFVKSLADHHS